MFFEISILFVSSSINIADFPKLKALTLTGIINVKNNIVISFFKIYHQLILLYKKRNNYIQIIPLAQI